MTSPYKEKYQSNATVFVLKDKTWIERGSGVVRFVFDLKSFALSLIVRPGMTDEYSCKLRPRIRSKGPRAYVVRAEKSATNQTESILAVRFEREEDSRAFRRFVEKREGGHREIQKNEDTAALKNKPRFQQPGYPDMTGNAGYMDPYTAADQQGWSHARPHSHQMQPNIMALNPNHPNQQMVMGSRAPGVVGVGMQGQQDPSYSAIQQFIRQQQQMQRNNVNENFYFWNCPNCRQMQDITVASCIVCGARRPPGTATTPMMNMANTPSNRYLPNTGQNQAGMMGGNGIQFQRGHAHRPQQGFSLSGTTPLALNAQPNNYTNVVQGMRNMSFIPNQSMSLNQDVNAGFPNPANATNPNTYQALGTHYSKVDYSGNTREDRPMRPRGYAGSRLEPIIVELTTANLEKHNVLHPPLRRNVGEIIFQNLQYLERLKLNQQTVSGLNHMQTNQI